MSKINILCISTAILISTSAIAQTVERTAAKQVALTPAQQAELIKRSVKILGSVLVQARKRVTSASEQLQSMNAKRGDITTKEAQLIEKANKSKVEHTKNEQALKEALSEDYRTQTTALIVPKITALHTTFFSFVDRYRAQAGLVNNSPEFIQGHVYRSTRPAMAEIVYSQNRDLLRIKEIIQSQSNFIQKIERELSNLGDDPNSFLARFGFDHYFTILLQRVDAQREIAQNSTILFNGLDSNDRVRALAERCQISGLPNFSDNLTHALSLSSGTYSQFRDRIELDLIKNFYDGNSESGFPGYISSWRGCYQNKQSNADNFSRDIEREAARNNIELARQLDFARADLEHEITVISMEADTLAHHSSQIQSLKRTAGLQGTTEILRDYPNAWKRTVAAHVNDLKTENLLYPALMSASDLLLERALNELHTLPVITDVQNRRAELKLVAEKLQSIRLAGYARLIEQVDSVNDQLNTMAISIGGGESFLEETISSYGLSARTKAQYWKAEQDKLPATLASSRAKVTQVRDDFNKSLELQKLTLQVSEEYKRKREELFVALDMVQNKIGNAQFNPIYSELSTHLFSSVGKNTQFLAVKAQLMPAVTNYLASFKGVNTKSLIVRQSVITQAAKPKLGLIKLLEKEKKLMTRAIATHIDEASKSYLGGKSLSAVMTTSHSTYESLMATPI